MTRPSADQLLDHAQFLRGLVASIAGRDDLAEDILQEVWLAAVQSPPGAGWDLRRWLGGVARNLTRQSRRDNARRLQRERSAARPELVPGTGETLARLESLRTLVDAVEALDPPYREVVMLRFFDAMPPREIARRLAVPVETVRTRLRRALALLRDKLDATHGDRATWSRCLLPFACGQDALRSPAAALAGVWTRVAVVVVALPAVGSGLVHFAAADPAVMATESVVAARAVVAVPPAGEEGTASARRATIPQAKTLRLHGRVTRPGALPYPSARVRVRCSSGFVAAASPEIDARVVADANGRWEWECPRPTGPVHLAVDCGVPNRETTVAKEVIWVPGDPDPEPIGLRCYPLDAEIAGTVRDAGGRPVPGAVVRAHKAETVSDRLGRYRVRGASALSGLEVQVYARGFVPAKEIVRLQAGQQHRLDFTLQPGVQVSGRVTTTQGEPIVGARVDFVYWDTNRREGATDAEGRYALTCLDPARPAHLSLSHDDFLRTHVVVDHGGSAARRDVVMVAGVQLRGAVVDAKGQPVFAATVRLFEGDDCNGSANRRVISMERGRFAIRAVRPVESIMIVSRRGHGPARLRLDLSSTRADLGDHDLRIVLPAPREVAVLVVDGAGKPVAGARLFCHWGANQYTSPSLENSCSSGPDGRVRLADLPREVVCVAAACRGWLRAHKVVAATDREIVLTMQRAGGLAGTVVDAQTGRPVESFRVRFVTPELQGGERGVSGYSSVWRDPGYNFTGLSGHWNIGSETLEVDTVTGLEFFAAGYATKVVPRVLVAADPDPKRFVVALDAGRELAGRVVALATGAPIAHATVRVLTANEELRDLAPAVENGLCAKTDGDGRFRIARVADGEIRLLVTHLDQATHIEGPFATREPRTVRVPSGGAVAGRVFGAGDRLVPGAKLCLRPTDAAGLPVWRDVVSDAEGGFRFDHVPAGVYELTWTEYRGSSGIVRRTYRVKVAPDRVVDGTMATPPGSGRVRGVVRAAKPLPPGCYVGVIAHTPAPVDESLEVQRLPGWIGVVADGRFELLGLPAGKYRLYLSRIGDGARVEGGKEIEVLAGRPLEVELRATVVGADGR